MLPDFMEFSDNLDFEALHKIINKAEVKLNPPEIVSFNLNDAAAWDTFFRMYRESIVNQCAGITLAYLAAYHEWLRQHLET